MIELFVGDQDRYSSGREAWKAFSKCFTPGFSEGEMEERFLPFYYSSITQALKGLERMDEEKGFSFSGPSPEGGWEAVPLPEEACIYVLPGIYQEHPSLCRPNIKLLGAGRDQVFLLAARGGRDAFGSSPKRGTFRSQTLFVYSRRAWVEDMTIANLAGQGSKAGQAIALYADGDELTFSRLNLIGRQDTLFCGPLPAKEVEPGGFVGPLEKAPRINGRQLFVDCHIEGTIDFIFGSGTAYFEACDILSVDPRWELEMRAGLVPGSWECTGEEAAPREPFGFVTAPSTPQGQAYGFVFHRCHLRGDLPRGSVYLGRPWREYAQSVFLECEIDGHICRKGWDDWNKPLAHKESFFAEYGCKGEGACLKERADFARTLSEQEAEHFSREKVLGF